MSFNRIADGGRISAVWHGRAITGVVESSRVKYGGKVQYTVNLDAPVMLRWRSEPTSCLLIDSQELVTGV